MLGLRWRGWGSVAVRAVLALGAAGCTEEVTGPAPQIEGDAGAFPFSPQVACRAQLATDIVVSGANFSPISIGLPGDPKLALPSLLLTHSHALDGGKADGKQILYSGSPDEPLNLDLLSWQSQSQMTFIVNQDVMLGTQAKAKPKRGALPVGLFDISVTNPNTDRAEQVGAVALVDKPELQIPTPGITCLAQGPRDITLSGTTFLEIDGKRAVLDVDGVDSPFEIAALEDCTEIDHSGVDAKYCTTAELTLGTDSIAAGFPALTLHNPETAACTSEEKINLRVAPPPEIDRIVPPMACVAQEDRTFRIEGRGFLTIDGALPALTLGGEAFSIESAEDCEALETQGHAVETCTALSFTLAEDALEPGHPEVIVTNPDPAGCSVSNAVALTIVAPPSITAVEPALVCLAEGERVVEVRGEGLLTVDGEFPALSFGDLAIDPAQMSPQDCTPIEVQGLDVQSCERIVVTLAQDALEPAVMDVSLTNPDPAGCSVTAESIFAVVPDPVISASAPPIVCVAESDRELILSGSGFIRFDDALPSITFDGEAAQVTGVDDCTDLPLAGHDASHCNALGVGLAAGSLATGHPKLVVTNPDPAGCKDGDSKVLTVVPPPSITSIEAALICLDEAAKTLQIAGTDFLVIEGEVPAVDIGGVTLDASAVVASECTALDVQDLSVEVCALLTVTVEQNQVPPGVQDVTVQNPAPAGCGHTASGKFAVAPAPSITSAEPGMICTQDSDRPIVLTGTGFLVVDGVLPTLSVDAAFATVTELLDCTPTDVAGVTAQTCTTLNATVAQGTPLGSGSVLSVHNPAAADCSGSSDTALTGPPPLAITSATPDNLCVNTGVQSVTVTGTGFLKVGDETFSVEVAGAPITPTQIGGCVALPVVGLAVESCDSFTFDADADALPVGDIIISVNNPEPSACSLTAETVFRIVSPPEVSSVQPDRVCSADAGTTLTITGTGFVEGMTVLAGATAADSVVLDSDTQVTAAFSAGLPAGTYDITVESGAGGACSDTAAAALLVDPTPFVFFIDPPVLYSGVSVEATVFSSGLDATAAQIDLIDSTGAVTNITDFSSPVRPNRIQINVPAGLPSDDYTVQVTSAQGCESDAQSSVKAKVTDALLLALDRIEPAYASTNLDTAVTILATDPPGAGLVGFASTPRVYLNPSTPDAVATALKAVTFNSAAQLTAVIPAGLSAGQYDLIVVNPTGEVGVLAQGVTITAEDPPEISAVVPSSLDNDAVQAARIVGTNLDAVDGNVNLICRAPGASTDTVLSATVTGGTSSELQADMPTGGLLAGTICLVEVVNGDGASFEFSAISVKSPSQNLRPWSAGPVLGEGRRALSLVAARPTSVSRFLYAIGGDDGTTAGAKTSVEAVGVDVFGDLGSWQAQRAALPTARTFAGVTQIGRFVYLTGGHDGTLAQASLLRAQVLDPLAGPELTDVDASLADAGGLAEGQWFYRLAATFPSTDANNPGGESLPGEPLTIALPQGQTSIALTLSWQDTPGASGYRVYRSPSADGSVDNLELIGEITCGDQVCVCDTDIECAFTDDGSVVPDAASTPLPAGSLGHWHAVAGAPMTTAREGHNTVSVQDPTDPLTYYLYAFGGRDAAGDYLDSYEWAAVSVDPSGEQAVSTWSVGPQSLGTAKADLGVWLVDNDDSNEISAGQVAFFIGSGSTQAGRTGELGSGLFVGGTGDLTTSAPDALDTETDLNPGLQGACAGSSSGYLYLFGGEGNGGLLSTDSSTQVITGPDLDNWNSLGGGSLVVRRSYAGAAQESAFYFVAGGTTASDDASTSVERTVQ